MKATTLSALAEPTRLRMVELMRDGPLSVGEIADKLGLGQPQTSKHLRILNDAGLVHIQPVANRRIYRLRSQPLEELGDWLNTFRRRQDERYDQLDAYLAQQEND